MSDSLSNGKTFRTLNVMDGFNREALRIEVDTSLPAEHVVRVLEQLLDWQDQPTRIRMDNGLELISQRLESWAKEKDIELLYIQPGKPAQNAYIERFNRTYREEVLDAYLFDDLEGWKTTTPSVRMRRYRAHHPPICTSTCLDLSTYEWYYVWEVDKRNGDSFLIFGHHSGCARTWLLRIAIIAQWDTHVNDLILEIDRGYYPVGITECNILYL